MNISREDDIILGNEAEKKELSPTTLIATAKIHEAKMRTQPLTPELQLDSLYVPLVEAATELRQKIETQYKQKIQDLKREGDEQTKGLYHKLNEAREEFKRLQENYHTKESELDHITQKNLTLKKDLKTTEESILRQQEEIIKHKSALEHIEKKHSENIQEINEKNNLLIDKLKSKIDQINQDYQQQITHLQQKMNYQKQQLSDELDLLRQSNHFISEELTTLKKEQNAWQEDSGKYAAQISTLELENNKLHTSFKEKGEKLLRSEHSLKLANEELERSQQYIKELEDKNNILQKELFENWIHKKEAF